MGSRDYYKKGDYNVICDRCGFKFKASECKMEWTGLFVCGPSGNNCWESRHPQDFIKSRIDKQSVPIARPGRDPASTRYVPCIAGIAVVGVSICGDGY